MNLVQQRKKQAKMYVTGGRDLRRNTQNCKEFEVS